MSVVLLIASLARTKVLCYRPTILIPTLNLQLAHKNMKQRFFLDMHTNFSLPAIGISIAVLCSYDSVQISITSTTSKIC